MSTTPILDRIVSIKYRCKEIAFSRAKSSTSTTLGVRPAFLGQRRMSQRFRFWWLQQLSRTRPRAVGLFSYENLY